MPRKGNGYRKVTTPTGLVRWKATVEDGVRPDGTRKQINRTFTTEREAKAWLARTRVELEDGDHVRRSGITLAEYVEEWLAASVARQNTKDGYRIDLRPALAALGHLPLQQITPARVVALRDDMRATGGRSGAGRSVRTVNLTLTVLGMVLGQARTQRLVTINAASKELVPRLKHTELGSKAKFGRWTPEQGAAFLAGVREDRYYAAWWLTFHGLRRSEVLGLRWSAIDLDAGTVAVSEGRVVPRGKRTPGVERTIAGAPKTTRGERTIFLDPEAVKALVEFRGLREREVARLRDLPGNVVPLNVIEPDAYVVVDVLGRPISPEFYSAMFRGHRDRLGLPAIRLHDCRGSVATWLHQSQTPVATAALYLGHSEAVYLSTYAKGDPGMKDASATLSRLLAPRSAVEG